MISKMRSISNVVFGWNRNIEEEVTMTETLCGLRTLTKYAPQALFQSLSISSISFFVFHATKYNFQLSFVILLHRFQIGISILYPKNNQQMHNCTTFNMKMVQVFFFGRFVYNFSEYILSILILCKVKAYANI